MSIREKELSKGQCEALLEKNIIGTLALSHDEKPYAIPLEYLYHGGALYMGTYFTGRKIDVMDQNSKAVFTVFEDRHGHPEMIQKKIPCRSVMVEGTVGTIHIKDFTSRKGVTKSYRLLKFDIESMGSWQCSRDVCHQAIGLDPKKILLDWLMEAEGEG